MMFRRTLAVLTAAAGCTLAGSALAGDGATPLTSIRFMTGLERPIWVGHAPEDAERLFVIEKRGRIRIIKNGSLLGAPFLDIDAIVGGGTSNNSEQGLLGLAFHQNYQNNGFFYVNYTNNLGDTVIARYSVSGDPDIANAGSAMQIMTYDQPFSNHNGGWIDFGPNDGYLYISAGDGGSFNDPGNRAQNLNTLLGKMLRVDVDGDDFPGDPTRNYAIPPDNPFAGDGGGLDEIWSYGLRNAWRNNFDAMTGDLYIADVGQNAWEEINFQPAASEGGENYGWRCMEGNHCTGLSGCTCDIDCDQGDLVCPIQEYAHNQGCSITGGVVYRGCAIDGLQGTYFYADYCFSTIWSFRYVNGQVTQFQNRTAELVPDVGSINNITSFGVDLQGEIYICDQAGGEIFKIVADEPIRDCNQNSIHDGCDIAFGTSQDINLNNEPDECETIVVGCPDAFQVIFGNLQSGDVADLCDSDDQRVVIEQRPPFSVLLPAIRVTVSWNNWHPNPASELLVKVEASSNALPPTVPQRIELFNYDQSSWQTIDERTATSTDSVVNVRVPSNAERYIQAGTRNSQVRLNWFDPGNVIFAAWNGRIDQANLLGTE